MDGHSQVRDICHCEVRGEAGLHSWKLLLTSLLIVSSGLFVQLQINPVPVFILPFFVAAVVTP